MGLHLLELHITASRVVPNLQDFLDGLLIINPGPVLAFPAIFLPGVAPLCEAVDGLTGVCADFVQTIIVDPVNDKVSSSNGCKFCRLACQRKLAQEI